MTVFKLYRSTGYVENTGNQTIEGIKTFSEDIIFSGSLIGSAVNNAIHTNTAGGEDTSRLIFAGGGSTSTSRGAALYLHGNEHSSYAGKVYIYGGSTENGDIHVHARGDSSQLLFHTEDSHRWTIDSNGHLVPSTGDIYYIGNDTNRLRNVYTFALNLERSNDQTCAIIKNTDSSFSDDIIRADSTRGANAAFDFFVGRSNNGSDVEVRLRGNGNCTCDGSFTGGGADYAEYFESVDLTMTPGEVVVMSGYSGMIRKYNSEIDSTSDIIGVIRPKNGNTSVIGNLPLKWHNKYLRDDFGSYTLDVNGDRQINPAFDDQQEYISREDRNEWYVIGLVGQVVIKHGQATNPNWKKLKDISQDITELWLIK